MNTHIDTLDKWWENAEEGAARKGDTIIVRYDGDGEYGIRISDADLVSHVNDIRILHRAPRPKPAWHDAPAVTATYRDDYGMVTGVWTPSGNHGYWIGPEDDVVMHDSLEDVTPLIEAKVTDEMVEAARQEARDRTGVYWERSLVSRMLTAALGLETE